VPPLEAFEKPKESPVHFSKVMREIQYIHEAKGKE